MADHPELDLEEPVDAKQTEKHESYTASLITQGDHRFYTLSMPSDVLAATCTVDTRRDNPETGFQRFLDQRRAQDIADYIDNKKGSIPSAIVLSAQPEAEMQYIRKTRTLRFKRRSNAFLILDGQHRVFGFRKAQSALRVPVVIYNNLTRAQECRLFIDINTKQRPVPSELLLDIKRLAETETDFEGLMRDVFDLFAQDPGSPLLGLLSPSERQQGKISRPTFNAALKGCWDAIAGSDASTIYAVLSAYLHACVAGLRSRDAADSLTNPTLFRALLLVFSQVAERVSDRHGPKFTVENFNEILAPFFSRVRKLDLHKPGASYLSLAEQFKKNLSSGFSISGTS